MKKFAFTLAEILITLTVIGVVSIMVLPNMIGHYQKKVLENQTKHFYSMMTLAIHNYMADHRADDLSDTPMYCEPWDEVCRDANKEVNNFVMKYLKVALKCDDFPIRRVSSENKCYGNDIIKPIDKNSNDYQTYSPSYVLMHGYAIDIESYHPRNAYSFVLKVDVNGQQGPNRGGRDVWFLYIYPNGSINNYGYDTRTACIEDKECLRRTIEANFDEDCLSSYFGRGCFAHFKDNGYKFDY